MQSKSEDRHMTIRIETLVRALTVVGALFFIMLLAPAHTFASVREGYWHYIINVDELNPRSYKKSYALGTLFPGDRVYVRSLESDSHWAWSYASGRSFTGWAWVSTYKNETERSLQSYSAAKCPASCPAPRNIELTEFAREGYINPDPPNDGSYAQVKVSTIVWGNYKLLGKGVYQARDPLNGGQPLAPLNSFAKWRYFSLDGQMVMAKYGSDGGQWGWIRCGDLSPSYFIQEFQRLCQDSQQVVALRSSNGNYVVAEEGGGGTVYANRAAIGAWETFKLRDLNGGALASGDAVNIQAANGMYLVAEGGGGSLVNANRAAAGEWERFVVKKLNGSGPIKTGDAVALQSLNGYYVVAEYGGGSVVNANRSAIGPWETFTLVNPLASSQQYSFRSANGLYVVAEYGGGSVVNANRSAIGPWETFAIIDLNGGTLENGDPVNIRAANGMYVVAENGGGGVVNANRIAAGEWEKFVIRKLNGNGPIGAGDAIAFQSVYGYYVVAENGGGSVVNANRPAIGPWETFTLIRQ